MNIKGTVGVRSLNSTIYGLIILLGLTTAYAQPSMKIRMNDNSYTTIKISDIDTIKFGYSVGDTAQGGVIVYVDATGWHGLVAAQTDETIGETVIMPWKPGPFNINFHAAADGIYTGQNNTSNIVFYSQPSGIYAAYYSSLSTINGYTDWYLPSKYELNLVYLQRAAVGGFASGVYWSSTTWDGWPESKAWAQFFYDGGYGNGFQFDGDQQQEFRVRSVRAF